MGRKSSIGHRPGAWHSRRFGSAASVTAPPASRMGPLPQALCDSLMTRERALDESWKGWLEENIERGCSRTELVEILRKHGFSLSSIREHMGEAFPEEHPVSRSEPLP